MTISGKRKKASGTECRAGGHRTRANLLLAGPIVAGLTQGLAVSGGDSLGPRLCREAGTQHDNMAVKHGNADARDGHALGQSDIAVGIDRLKLEDGAGSTVSCGRWPRVQGRLSEERIGIVI